MNIFKILANGEGRINETNVSAFLGYLLDPNANHSLEYEFLKRFFKTVINDENFKADKYDYQIFFEQGFKNKDKKQKVDIVVVCTKTDNGEGSETKVKNYIGNHKSIKKVFLIENKIQNGSITKNQINNQYEAFINEFGNEGTFDVYSIYVTPKDIDFDKEFKQNKKASSTTHIYWKDKDTKNSIKNMLIDIVSKENIGEIEAINEYTRHTLKSFIQFIETDFKSEKEIEKIRRTDGVFTKDEKTLNEESHIEEKLGDVKRKFEERFRELKVGNPNLSRPKSPELWIFAGDILITINAGFKPRGRVSLSYRVNAEKENSRASLELLANALNLSLKDPTNKKMSYCSTPEMDEKISIESDHEIISAVEKAIENIENVFKVKV